MSALPTADEGRSQVVGSRVSTLPRGATTTNSDEYTVMEVGVIVGSVCVYDVRLVLYCVRGWRMVGVAHWWKLGGGSTPWTTPLLLLLSR